MAGGGAPTRRRSRLRGITNAPRRIWQTEFHLQVALLALARWDRLGAAEQARFRELAAVAVRSPLDPATDKELRTLLKRLEVRALVREIVAIATRPGRSE